MALVGCLWLKIVKKGGKYKWGGDTGYWIQDSGYQMEDRYDLHILKTDPASGILYPVSFNSVNIILHQDPVCYTFCKRHFISIFQFTTKGNTSCDRGYLNIMPL